MTTALTEDDLYEMVNLRSRSTGLRNNIWVGPRSGARHGPRIKVQMDHRHAFDREALAVVALDGRLIDGHLTADDLDRIRRYIDLNREAILDHWNEKIDGAELIAALKPLS